MATVKINTKSAEDWNKRIKKIKNNCADDLEKFLKKVNSTSNYFEGNAADGLCDNIKEFISTASNYTEQLTNLSTTLDTIVKVMKNQ